MNRFFFYGMLLVAAGTINPAAARAGEYTDNGVFLGHAYVKYPKQAETVAAVCEKMANENQCRYWFVNCGLLDSDGTMKNAAAEMAALGLFLGEIRRYEQVHQDRFHVVAWLNSAKENLDLSRADIRSSVVRECVRFVCGREPGSYVAGNGRVFDGVMFDIEPSGRDDVYFGHYKQLMDEVKAAFGSRGLADKTTSVCAHRHGTRNAWFWSPEYYYEMGPHVDWIMAMTYNSESKTPEEFSRWMSDQTHVILRAVSGRYWNDAAHPEPANGVKVFLGFAAYPASRWHAPEAENCRYGAVGVRDGLTRLKADTADPSVEYFQGAAVYLYTDGTGTDCYSGENTDWNDFRQYWLKRM